MNKNTLSIGIIVLFILSAVSPISIGYIEIKQFSTHNISDTINRVEFGNPPIANFTIHIDDVMGYVFFDGSSSYDSDGEIVLYEWDYGDGNTYNSSYDLSDNQYCNEGTYNVTLTVTDNDGLTGNLTKSVDIILANLPPPNVEIDGPDSGNAGTEYEFRFKVFIFYDAPFYIKVDWGDGNNTVWINVLPYYYVDLSHKWSKEGKYTIRAKAKDLCREGQWTEFEVRVTRDKTIASSVLLKFLEQFPLLQSLFMHLGLQ